jgi:hypothetical protein
MRIPKRRIESLIYISYARDKQGRYWWGETSDPRKPPDQLHGPFKTEAEAETDADRVALGGAKVEDAHQVIHRAPSTLNSAT